MQNVKILCHKNITNDAATSQNCTPQATAVELAQLGGGGDSPQCVEMSRRDKRARYPLKMGDQLSPLTEVLIRGNWNLREICETTVRHSEKQKKFL